jgi:hypothetical protein
LFAAAGLALLVGGFILVRKLEDFVVGAGVCVGYREGFVVDFFLEVPVGFVAEAVEEERGKVLPLSLSGCRLVVGRVAVFIRFLVAGAVYFVIHNFCSSRVRPWGPVR